MHISTQETNGLPLRPGTGTGDSRKITPASQTSTDLRIETQTLRSDTVELSPLSTDVQRIERLLLRAPETRDDLMIQATSALAMSSLNLNGLALAERILADPLHRATATV